MASPTLYREIKRMIPQRARHTKMARGIARKSGVRIEVAGSVVIGDRPRTLVDAYVDPGYGSLNWQWRVDLTPFSAIRFLSTTGVRVYLWRSPSGADATTGPVDPGDYEVFIAPDLTSGIDSEIFSQNSHFFSSDLRYYTIPEGMRNPCRLSISSSAEAYGINAIDFSIAEGSGFGCLVEAF